MQSTSIEIPNKSHFKVNEVCTITGVKPYVLRYWETEFEQIQPVVSSSGQKMYEQKDIEAIALVKNLLFDKKMTIERARLEMDQIYSGSPQNSESESNEKVKEAQSELPKTQRSLSDGDLQKIIMAKAKLNSLVLFTNELKDAHNWA